MPTMVSSKPRSLGAVPRVMTIEPSPWDALFHSHLAPAPDSGPEYAMAMWGSRSFHGDQTGHCRGVAIIG